MQNHLMVIMSTLCFRLAITAREWARNYCIDALAGRAHQNTRRDASFTKRILLLPSRLVEDPPMLSIGVVARVVSPIPWLLLESWVREAVGREVRKIELIVVDRNVSF